MASRLKEDEKNEKAIRGLLKQTPNRRCINCNSLGPQYVCTNFWTFVCTNCSGIHREFTHRVKSVSMAKFTSQEVTALQQGGNQKAREIYFKDYDTSCNQLPDSSNVDKLRDFIKHVYVERRFSGERPPRGKTGFDGPERRSDSRSPSYEENYGERRTGSGSFGGRKYDDRGNVQDERKSPGHYEYDRSRYDRKYDDYKRSPGFEDRRWSDERSPNYQKGYDSNSPPPVRPVREILGDDVPTLRVNDYGSTRSLPEIRKDFRNQRTASSSSMGSIEGTSPTLPRASTSSLIDFSVEPEPSASVSQKESSSVPTASLTPTQVQDPFVPPVRPSSAAAQPDLFAASLTSNPSNVGTQDPFVASFTNQASNARSHDPFAASSTKQSSNAGSQDPFMAAFLGSQAPVPASTTGQQSAPSAGNGGWATFDFGRPAPAGIVPTTSVETNSQVPAQSSASTMATPLDSFGNATTSEGWASQWAAPQTQGTNSLVTNGNNWSATFPQSTSNNNASGLQSWSEILPSTASAPNNTSQNVQQPPSVGKPPIPGTQNALPLQSVAKPPIPSSDTVSQKGQQPTTSKQNGRTEISEDLFKSPYPQPVQQHMGVHHMGVHMVSPYGGVVTPSFPSGGMSFPGSVQFNRPPSRSTNPFDTVTDVPAAHGSSFLNMGSMQNALPNYAAPAAAHASIQGPFGTPLGPSPVPAPIQPTAVPGLMSQQLPNQAPFNMHSVAPPTNNFSSASFNGDDFFSNLGNSHYPPQSSVPSVSGNPFG